MGRKEESEKSVTRCPDRIARNKYFYFVQNI